ncbi:MAG: hypothetical protein ACKO6H_03300 [Betaproteobacteria bacterium]
MLMLPAIALELPKRPDVLLLLMLGPLDLALQISSLGGQESMITPKSLAI